MVGRCESQRAVLHSRSDFSRTLNPIFGGPSMFTTLRKIAGATAVVPVRQEPRRTSGAASLRKVMTCRICGRKLRLSRFVNLSPSGVRGYYCDTAGHIVAIDRSGVTQQVRTDAHRIYFA